MSKNSGRPSIETNLRQVRTRQGLSQQELARRAGVTRQTIGGIEGGRYAPSAAVALKLARVLGCRVEDLFFLTEEDTDFISARPAPSFPPGSTAKVALARIDGDWIAHSLAGEEAFRTELLPADGEAHWDGRSSMVPVEPFDDEGPLSRTVVLAGCTPALSLWARAAERWNPGIRILWKFRNSLQALDDLVDGTVHGAGLHLYDEATGTFNIPFIKEAMPHHSAAVVNIGLWEEGIMTAPGNPLAPKSIADMAVPGVTIVNREPGAGSRLLLERELAVAGIPPSKVAGFETAAAGHIPAAQKVARGEADAAIGIAAVARIFRLHFKPVQRVRYDMVFRRAYLEEPHVHELITTLRHPRVKEQLRRVAGYDTTDTGEITFVEAQQTDAPPTTSGREKPGPTDDPKKGSPS